MGSNDRPLDSWNLMDPAVQQCPYDFYRATRASAPLYLMPQTGFRIVTSFDLCREVIRQPDLFASGVSPMALREGGVPQAIIDIYQNEGWLPTTSCSTTDPPQHTRVRAFLEPLFTVQRVRQITPLIDATVRELLDGIAGRTTIEFVREFSHPLPMMIIADLIGVPRSDLPRFKAWSDAIVEPFSMMVSPEREIECARLVVEMQHYFAALLDDRRRSPRDDLLTAVVRAADDTELHFDLREQLTILTIDLLASGNETTTAAITSGLKLLVENPQTLQELHANPVLMRNFADEVLRLESPAQGMFRRVTRDTVLGGVQLREGDLLSLRFGAANRDESQFPAADRIDLHRSQPGKHLALGIGRHHCIGAQLARQEIISALGAVIERYEAVALAPGEPPPEYSPSFFGRNLRHLHVTLTPRNARGQ
jgi:cytochrome P450